MIGVMTDACGRVTSVQVVKSSGRKAFDTAAVNAASQWTLSAKAMSMAVNGIVTMPVEFKTDFSEDPTKTDWPKTHNHVRWVLNENPTYYPSANAATGAIEELDPTWRMSPYDIANSRFAELQTAAGKEFWYFISAGDGSGKTPIAAHYQLVYDNNEPIVRLSVFCDLQPEQCMPFQKLFMKGLKYARPK